VARRREIGLSDLEVDDRVPLRFERSRAHQHFESGFDADAGHSFCEFHGLPVGVTIRSSLVGTRRAHP
jgi:hypothetical protein